MRTGSTRRLTGSWRVSAIWMFGSPGSTAVYQSDMRSLWVRRQSKQTNAGKIQMYGLRI